MYSIIGVFSYTNKIAIQKGAIIGGADSRFVNQFNLVEGLVIVRGEVLVLCPLANM